MKRIGFFPRLFASIIDGFLYIGILLFLFWILYSSEGENLLNTIKTDDSNLQSSFGLATLFISWLPLIIDITTESFFAGSPGKLILGLRIGRSDGRRATFLRLLVRCMLKKPPLGATLIASPFLLVGFGLQGIAPTTSNLLIGASVMAIGASCLLVTLIFIGGLFIFSSSKMALHDMVADTAVFSKEDLEYQDLPSAQSPKPPSTSNYDRSKNNRAVNELIFKK